MGIANPQPAPPQPPPPPLTVYTVVGGRVVGTSTPDSSIGQAFAAAMNALGLPPDRHAQIPLSLASDRQWKLGGHVLDAATLGNPEIATQLQQIATQILGAQPPAGGPVAPPPVAPTAPAAPPLPPPPAALNVANFGQTVFINHVQSLLPQLQRIHNQLNPQTREAQTLNIILGYFDPSRTKALLEELIAQPTLQGQLEQEILNCARHYCIVQHQCMSQELQQAIPEIAAPPQTLDQRIDSIHLTEQHLSTFLLNEIDLIEIALQDDLQAELSPALQTLKTELQSQPTLKRLIEIDQETIQEFKTILNKENETLRRLVRWEAPYVHAVDPAADTRDLLFAECQGASQAFTNTFAAGMNALLQEYRTRLRAHPDAIQKFAASMPENTVHEAADKYTTVREAVRTKLRAARTYPEIAPLWGAHQNNIDNSQDLAVLIGIKATFQAAINANRWVRMVDLFA